MKRECSGRDVPDVTLQKEIENHKFTFISEKINSWNTFFGTLANLLHSVQKNLSVRTLIIQKSVTWFVMQKSWLVSKPSTFLVKGISKQALTHLQPMFHLCKPGRWFLLAKCLKKHLWKSDNLSKDAGHWPASLLKMSLYHRYF